MCNKTELIDFLQQISEGAIFTKFKYESKERFIVKLKCKVAEGKPVTFYNDFAKVWKDKFSLFTKSGWIVNNCFSRNMTSQTFRKTYACQNMRVEALSARNYKCHAMIEFRNKFINKKMKNDPNLQNGLNMHIYIRYEHSHAVNDTACFNLLKNTPLPRTNEVFNKYFNDGYTASTAKWYHELRLTEKYGEDSDQLANESINPSLRHILYLYKSEQRPRLNEHNLMLKRFEMLEKAGHTIKYSYCPQSVVIITPLMKRVISQMGVEKILVDATLVHGTPFIMFLYVPSKIGSIPIACVIFDQLSEANYTRIFFTIKLALESECNIHFEPKLLVVGDQQARDALTTMFPNAEIIFNQFLLCKQIWEWISHRNKTKKPHDVMGLFKTLIYATSKKEAERIYGTLRTTTLMQSCLGKLEEIWENHCQWIGNGQCRGFSEAPLAFMREILMQRCNSFNICGMIDVVTNILERHYKKIIKSHIDGGVTAMYTKFLLKLNIGSDLESFKKINPNQYTLKCHNEQSNFNCILDIDNMCCNCKKGVKGRLCEHLCGLLNYIHESLVPMLTETEKAMFLGLVHDDALPNDDNLDLEELYEMPGANNDTHMLLSSEDDCSFLEEKMEETHDPLEDNYKINSSGNVKEDIKVQYEAAMKSVNNEFRRLNKLFKENPNNANLETMTRLARELGKIRPIEKADLSEMFITLNSKSEN